MNSLITYLASTLYFFCSVFFTIKLLKTDITNSVSTLCILLCPAIFFLLNFSYQSCQPPLVCKTQCTLFFALSSPPTPSQSSLMSLPPTLHGRISKSYVFSLWLFYLDIAFLGDRVYFLSLMICILHKRKLRFRKKKVTFPRSYKYIIPAEHTHLSPEFMLSYMLRAYALKLYALNQNWFRQKSMGSRVISGNCLNQISSIDCYVTMS